MSVPRTVHHLSDMLAVLLGLLLNSLLLGIVRVERRGPLRSYGTVVSMNCIMDFALIATTLLAEIVGGIARSIDCCFR